jgi:hypothetical protein
VTSRDSFQNNFSLFFKVPQLRGPGVRWTPGPRTHGPTPDQSLSISQKDRMYAVKQGFGRRHEVALVLRLVLHWREIKYS